jgi:hypothetical protein
MNNFCYSAHDLKFFKREKNLSRAASGKARKALLISQKS